MTSAASPFFSTASADIDREMAVTAGGLVGIAVLIVAVLALYYYFFAGQQGGPRKTYEELVNFTGHPTTVWGPAVWKLMHIVAINFPIEPTDEDRKAFSTFIAGLALTLPCANCRMHFQSALAGQFALQPADLESRNAVFAWTVRVHAAVNKRLSKNYTDNVDHWFRVYTLMRNG